MRLAEALAGRLAIWGTGQEGLGLAVLALARGVEPLLVDDRPAEAAARARALGHDLPVVAPGAAAWTAVDVVVRSPGVSRYRPELGAARAAGARVTTAMALWLEDVAGERVVAVTGTKGKSTTAALTAAVLAADGWDVELLGNIGVPVTTAYDRPPAGVWVVEVSSFQAADVTRTPGVVVLTGLAPDHLDWHGGVEAYYRDKLRLVTAGPPGELAVNAASDEAVRRTAGHARRTLYGPTGRVRAAPDGTVELDGAPLIDGARLGLPGRHNLDNLCGAVAGALLVAGRPPTPGAVARAVDGFAGLPSRCMPLGERDGRTFVDDALASNPSATAASVAAFAGRPLTVVLGGADRGVDPEPLVAALTAHRPPPTALVLPPDPERLAGALTDRLVAAGGVVRAVADLGEAVAVAASCTPPGGVVLFSPGAPTPEGGGGYRARSRAFAEAAGLDAAGGRAPGRPVPD